ncbi:MAG: WYL domain-containing protein, partial [Clostridiaceae bacterium]|nr:WYL domain-containing protein [Clostridiaceae bacterium]
PITFTWENHDGYLYAYCRLREDFRHFKFSGIQRLTLVEGSFTHHLDPLEDWNEDWEDDWEEEDSSEPYYDIVFSCTEDLLGEVFLSFDEEVEVLKESAGGRYLLSVYAPFSPMVLGFFMGFGQKLKVLMACPPKIGPVPKLVKL